MYIHNYFSDVLLSIRSLFDFKIFDPLFIKNYEFNIANRAFTLSKNDYKTTYSLPTCLISYVDETYTFGERPNVIQKLMVENNNMIPVLYDYSSGNTIYVQEEHHQIRVSAQINCESQLQAKEVEFQIRRTLPLDKYIQISQFTSFLEISPQILQTLGMDYNSREIANLFTRLNGNTGQMEYCFSISYKPIIKLENISVNIAESGSRTFLTAVDLLYQIQVPMWLCFEKGHSVIEKINIDFNRIGYDPISQNSCRTILVRHDELGKFFRTHINIIMPDLDMWWKGECDRKEDKILILQKYIDQKRVNICDLSNFSCENNPDLKYLIDSNLFTKEEVTNYINKNMLKSSFIFDLLYSNIIDFSDLLHFLAYSITKDTKLIFKDLYESCNFTYDEINIFVKGFLTPYPKVIVDLELENFSYRDLYELIETNTTKNLFLENLYNTSFNITFMLCLFNNKILIRDLYDYHVSGKTENFEITNILDKNILNISNFNSIFTEIGMTSKSYLDSNILFTISLEKNLFIFSDKYVYNIMDTSGNVNFRVPPFFIDTNTNTLYFKITKEESINKFSPTLTTPIIIQVGEYIDDVESISSCDVKTYLKK